MRDNVNGYDDWTITSTRIYDARNCHVATLGGVDRLAWPGTKETAEFIVRCCNAHEDLLAALEATLNYSHPTWCRSRRSDSLPCSCYQRDVRAAIKKATKG
jgi:hypothetical protein